MSDSTQTEAIAARAPLARPESDRGPSVIKLGRKLPPLTPEQLAHGGDQPDWVAANPRRIAAALERSQRLPTGGWFTIGSSRKLKARVRKGPLARQVNGVEYVLWYDGDTLRAAPNACPHMGARLDESRVCDGRLVCPWHGLALGAEGRGAWKCVPVHDDGVLLWLQLPEEGQEPLPAPPLPPRPAVYLDGVIELEAVCTPPDVLANRLDPWHGVYLHPYGFAELALTGERNEGDMQYMLLRVAKRVLGPICVEVDISFHCASARSIVMTILDGEGAGSVVETYATPIGEVKGEPRCAIIEATLASSDRPGFAHAQKVAGLIRPFIRKSAAALWADDLPYAERLYQLRKNDGQS